MLHKQGPVLTHLRSHPADGWNIITSIDEVGSVLLQLELTQPLIDGLGILQHTTKHTVVQTVLLVKKHGSQQ